jgi:hypothetical protein
MRCFSSVRSLLFAYVFSSRYLGCPRWVAPFGDLRVRWLCAPNRSLSQLITSFIADGCQGIPHLPLSASKNCKSYRIFQTHPLGRSVVLHPTQRLELGTSNRPKAISLAEHLPLSSQSPLSRCLIDSLNELQNLQC